MATSLVAAHTMAALPRLPMPSAKINKTSSFERKGHLSVHVSFFNVIKCNTSLNTALKSKTFHERLACCVQTLKLLSDLQYSIFLNSQNLSDRAAKQMPMAVCGRMNKSSAHKNIQRPTCSPTQTVVRNACFSTSGLAIPFSLRLHKKRTSPQNPTGSIVVFTHRSSSNNPRNGLGQDIETKCIL